MCDPVTLSIVGGVQAGLGIVGQRSAAKAQFGALADQRQRESDEINAADSARLGARVKQGRAERARLRVAGGEAGISGNSFEAQLFNSFFQEDSDAGTISKSSELAQTASASRFDAGVNSVRSPTLLESGLQIATGAFAGFQQGKALQSRFPKSTKPLSIPTGTIDPDLAIGGTLNISSRSVA